MALLSVVHVFQLANMILPEEENFLLLFRREAPLDNSVDFMKVRLWKNYLLVRDWSTGSQAKSLD